MTSAPPRSQLSFGPIHAMWPSSITRLSPTRSEPLVPSPIAASWRTVRVTPVRLWQDRVMPWPAVQHLGLPVRDPRRSSAFYRDLLGFRELQANDHIAELTMGETRLVLLRAEEPVAPRDMHF